MFKLIIISLVCIIATSCNSGNNPLPSANLGSVNAGVVATIPILATTSSSTMMVVNNNTSSNLKLINTTVKVNGLVLSLQQQKQLINISNCNTLTSNNQCVVIITPPRQDGSFIINMQYTNDNGIIYNTAQLINYSSLVKQNNGLIYFKPNKLKFKPGKNSISIPIMLASRHKALNPAINNFFPGATTKIYCPHKKLNVGDMCTLIVNFSIPENNMQFLNTTNIPQLVLSATLDGDSSNKLQQTHSLFLSVSSNNAGNLITDGINVQISPTLNPTITLFNNGRIAVTNIKLESITPLIPIPSGTNPCTTTLNAGSSCTFTLHTDSSATTGATNILVLYNNGLGVTNSLSFNAYYTTTAPAPLLMESSNGWLLNSYVNSVNYTGIYVINNGNITLNNLQFGALGPAGMNYGGYGQTCVNGQSLAPLASCIMLINYYPTVATAGVSTFNVTASASYPDQSGTALSYLANFIMQYSANSNRLYSTYIVGGDYGALTISTTGSGTWTTVNSTPFTTTSTSINRMVNNASLQVLGTSDGLIYSADHGMIWQANNLNAPGAISGLTYDSTNGYLVTATGSTSLYYTSSLKGTSTSWTTQAGWFTTSPINLFNFGGYQNCTYRTTSVIFCYLATLGNSSEPLDISSQFLPTSSAFRGVSFQGVPISDYTMALYDGINFYAFSPDGNAAHTNTSYAAWFTESPIYGSGILTQVATNSNIISSLESYVAVMSTTPWVVYLNNNLPLNVGYWTAATSSPGIALSWVTYGASGGFVAVSSNSPSTVWSSPNGSLWTQQTQGTANNPANESYTFDYYDGTNYWASGNNVLKVSQNGVNWSNAGIKSMSITYVNGNLIYLAVGTDGAIESSLDLNTWTPSNLSITNQLNDVQCFNSNNCYIIGNNGTILFSNNGLATAWALESASTLQNLNGIACGYSNCVIVGSGGTILTESIGSNVWSIESSTTSQTLNSIAFNNVFNIYVAVGNNGMILSSSDGINWNQMASGISTNNLNSITCGYSQIGCMAVGAAGTVVASVNGISWQIGASLSGTLNSVAFYNGIWIIAQNGGMVASAADIANPSALSWTSIKVISSIRANLNLNTALAF